MRKTKLCFESEYSNLTYNLILEEVKYDKTATLKEVTKLQLRGGDDNNCRGGDKTQF